MNIHIEKSAKKFIERQPPKTQTWIMRAIFVLPKGDIVPMANMSGYYRLRVGDYRVVFFIDYTNNTIIIYNAGNRGDIYK